MYLNVILIQFTPECLVRTARIGGGKHLNECVVFVRLASIVEIERAVVIYKRGKSETFIYIVKSSKLTFSFILEHLESDLGAFVSRATANILLDVTEGTDRHGHENDIEVGTLVDPASVTTVGVETVVGDEIRLEILLPVSDALHLIIGQTVNVHRKTKLIHGKTIIGVNLHYFAIRVADAEIGNVFFAINVGSRELGDTASNSCLELDVSSLFETKFARNRTLDGDRVFGYENVVLPFVVRVEHCPCTHRGKLVGYHCLAFPISNHIVVSRHKVEAHKVFLAVRKIIQLHVRKLLNF